MSKSIYFSGQPLFAYLLQYINRDKIIQIAREGDYDRYTKKLNGYTHLITLLFAVLKGYNSLREIIMGMIGEVNKVEHLGIKYVARRSTLAKANNRRSPDFFEEIYFYLLRRLQSFLPDSRSGHDLIKGLYIIDSTTIPLFGDILKGVGRTPNSGRRKGGVKVHTVIRAEEGVPRLVNITAATTHDAKLMSLLNDLPKGSIIAMDRGYNNYSFFREATEREITYVTKAKSNMRYRTLSVQTVIDEESPQKQCYEVRDILLVDKDKNEVKVRMISYQEPNKPNKVVLLTNNFESSPAFIAFIYLRRWQIESLYKQLKQNFQLRYFFGESENAIRTQIWVTLIANLLLMVVKARTTRKWSFSNLVSVVRNSLMYYIDLYYFLADPEKALNEYNRARAKSPPKWTLFGKEGLDF